MRKIPSTGNEDKAVLGQGYDVNEERFAGLCVLGDRQFAGTQESSVSFDKKVSETEVADSLGFSVGGKARYGMITGSLSAEFASSSSSSDYSEVAVYSAKYQFKNQKLNYTGLTPQGQQAKGSAVDSNFVWENWEKTCGHEFVEQVVQGASLYISIKLEFSTKASKTSFDAQFSLSGPMFEVGGKLNIASQQFGKTASLSIQAYQLGGDVAKLSQALNASLGDKPEIKAIAVCSMDNPDACLKLLNGAIKYATDEFPTQINPALGADNPAGPADLIYIIKPWSDLALYSPPSIIADGVKVAREDLSFQFERNLKYRNRVRALQNGPLRLSPAQQTKIELIDTTVSDNLSLINDAANVCYSQMDRCVAKVDEVKTLLKSFNEEDFDVYPETIAQWYEIKDLPSTLKEIKRIMERLEELVKGRVNDWNSIRNEDKGDLIEELLKEEKILDLRALEISKTDHLSWLSSLKSLISINLSDNQIIDISPLSSLVNLTSINLSNNQIVNISPLSSLVNLTSIDFALNQIVDISPLSSLVNLTSIDFSNNKIIDINPIVSLVNLISIDFSSYLINFNHLQSSLLQSRIDQRNQIVEINPLVALVNLISVALGDNPIVDIKSLSSLVNLKKLDIGDISIQNAKIENSASDLFNNLFFSADKISVTGVDGHNPLNGFEIGNNPYTGIWTRQGTSNIFDTQESYSNGAVINGVARVWKIEYSGTSWKISISSMSSTNNNIEVELSSDGQQVIKGTKTFDSNISWTATAIT